MTTLKRIRVATDFGEASETALPYGRNLPRGFGAKLDVVHVAENVLARAIGIDGYIAACLEIQGDVDDAVRISARVAGER